MALGADELLCPCHLCGAEAVIGPLYEEGELKFAVLVECPTCSTYIISFAARERLEALPRARQVLSGWSKRCAGDTRTPFRVRVAEVEAADAEARIL